MSVAGVALFVILAVGKLTGSLNRVSWWIVCLPLLFAWKLLLPLAVVAGVVWLGLWALLSRSDRLRLFAQARVWARTLLAKLRKGLA